MSWYCSWEEMIHSPGYEEELKKQEEEEWELYEEYAKRFTEEYNAYEGEMEAGYFYQY